MVCADTEVTGTEIKTEAVIKAATDIPQLLVFACIMVFSFPDNQLWLRLLSRDVIWECSYNAGSTSDSRMIRSTGLLVVILCYCSGKA